MARVERLFVWAGGTLFVAALALAAYRFFVSWSDATPPGAATGAQGWRAALVNAALFGIFAAHHSMFARDRVKAWLSRAVPERLVRSVYVWTASLLLIGLLILWRPIGGDVYRVRGWPALALALVQLTGGWLIVQAVGVIDPLELAGIRRHAAHQPLQVTGPYGLVRHPLYLGWMLALFGAAGMTGDRLAFAVTSSVYLLIAIPWEERSLERAFGAEYKRYKARVRWRLIPYLY